MKTTNYINTFIEVAEDCTVKSGEILLSKGSGNTVANIQVELIIQNPYRFTSDEVLFTVYATKNNISKKEIDNARSSSSKAQK